ncbi:MAG: PrgI family mobile element protein [Actinomycetota bacterium]
MKARIPADVDMADRIFAGLTARQLVILGGHAFALWALWAATAQRLHPYAFGALAVPVAALAFVWATVKVEGTALERLAVAGLGFLRTPRRRVFAPYGVPVLPRWMRLRVPCVAPLDLPVAGTATQECVDLSPEGSAVLCRASSLNFALRSEAEQRALIEGFGRLLNALDEEVQFLVRSDRVELEGLVEEMERRAGALPHPALEAAALEHGVFLRTLAGRRDVLTRQVFICFRDRRPSHEAASRLTHRVEEAATFLRGMGVRLRRLDAGEASRLIARACDPACPPARGALEPDELVEGRC